MDLNFVVRCKVNGKIVESRKTETEFYSIKIEENSNGFTVTVEPKRQRVLELIDFYAESYFKFGPNDEFFAGGYQSWTKTREYKKDEIQKGIMKLANVLPITRRVARLTSDEHFVEYSEKPGEFHSHCYTYVRNGDALKFWGSLDESSGFTYFKVKMNENYFSVRKDAYGKVISEPWKAFDIAYFEGSYDEVFDKYFAAKGITKKKLVPVTGYTSWYNYFQKINEEIILRDLNGLDRVKDFVSVFQIDDGYETAVGDWLDPCDKFPKGMKYIADKIREKGYKPGIWLAPFNCQRTSRIAKERPDLLVKDEKGRPQLGCVAWGGAYVLDIYNSEARERIRNVFDVVLGEWGYEMVKLDFLYSECMSPRNGKCRGEIMSDAMAFLRECVGDKTILGCGVPISSAIGAVDACRIGCDVDLSYGGKFYNRFHISNEMISAQAAINDAIFRRGLDGGAFMNDPDVFFLRKNNLKFTDEQKLLLARIANLCGSVLFVSDNVGDYDDNQIALLKKFFTKTGEKIVSAEYIDKDVIRIISDDAGKRKTLEFNLKSGKILRDDR